MTFDPWIEIVPQGVLLARGGKAPDLWCQKCEQGVPSQYEGGGAWTIVVCDPQKHIVTWS